MSDDNEVVKLAVERFKTAKDACAKFKKLQQDDLRFISGEQWNEKVERDRANAGRPVFTINKLPSFVRQIVNEQRQNKPSIEVNPVGDGADKEIADIMSGLIKHIEYDSNADLAYDNAGWYAASTGEGYFRLVSDYEDEKSFDQRLIIKQVANPANVFIDPASVDPDGSDMEYGFIIDEMSKDEFERLYPNADTTQDVKDASWDFIVMPVDWMTTDSVRIAEYYYKTYKSKTLYHCRGTDLEGKQIQWTTTIKPNTDTVTILNKRKIEEVTVNWAKINGREILEETVFPGKYIPLFPVYGDNFIVDDVKYTAGIVRSAKDSQRQYNFFASTQAELVDMAPKVPFIGAVGQFDGREHQWRDANVVPMAYLEYNIVDVNGSPLPPPSRVTWEAPIQAVASTRQMAGDDMKAVTGIFDPSLGDQGNETSGKAILARQSQTNTSNFHYIDNLHRAIRHLGKVIVDVIPKFYDTARIIRIVKPSGEQEMIAINTITDDGMKDLSVGKYDVVLKTGPSYQTRRQEAVDAGMDLMGAYPQAAPLIADIITANMDWHGADLIAKRLKTQIPPQVLQATGETQGKQNAEQMLPQVIAQAQQMGQQLEHLNAYAEQMEQQNKNLVEENKLLKESSQVKIIEIQNKSNIEEKKLALDEKQTVLDYEIKMQEIEISKRELVLREKQIGIAAIHEGAEIMDKMHSKAVEHIDRINTGPEVKIDDDAQGLNNTDTNGQ